MKSIAILLAMWMAPASAQNLPDVEIRAQVQAERVEVNQSGEAKLEITVEPGEAQPVRVERSAPEGQVRYRNLIIKLKGEARIADPVAIVSASAHQEPKGETE